MSREINLILGKKKSTIGQERTIFLARITAIVCVSAILLLSVSLFFITKDNTLSSLAQQDKAMTQNLTLLQSKIITLLIVEDRLRNIEKIIKKQVNFDQPISDILSALPHGIEVESFSLDPKTISITVSSDSLSSLNTFLDVMIGRVNNKQLYKSVTVESLIADTKTGKYILSFDAQPL